MEEVRPKIESFRVETPLGVLESDSGNHCIDVASIIVVILFFGLGRAIIKMYFPWNN
tara:strand:+ start:1079 stop:1249 length:171 start_codon:yes stop_codon:yes gene_type:complete